MLRGILLVSLQVYVEGDQINSRTTEILYMYIFSVIIINYNY